MALLDDGMVCSRALAWPLLLLQRLLGSCPCRIAPDDPHDRWWWVQSLWLATRRADSWTCVLRSPDQALLPLLCSADASPALRRQPVQYPASSSWPEHLQIYGLGNMIQSLSFGLQMSLAARAASCGLHSARGILPVSCRPHRHALWSRHTVSPLIPRSPTLPEHAGRVEVDRHTCQAGGSAHDIVCRIAAASGR